MARHDDLNDFVQSGKAEIDGYATAYFQTVQAQGDADQRRAGMSVRSLLTLSLKKGAVTLEPSYLRGLIIEENYAVLTQLADNDERLLPLFAAITGRVTQIREYLAALDRIRQTYSEDGDGIAAFLDSLSRKLESAGRAGARLSLDASGALTLPALNMLVFEAAEEPSPENRPAAK